MNFILGGVTGYDGKTTDYQDRTTFIDDVRLNLNSSFTGKDLPKTRLRSANFTATSPFNDGNSLFKLNKASSTNASTGGAGALVRNTEILAFIPTAYRSQQLDFFTTAGSPGGDNKATGQGFWNASVNIIAQDHVSVAGYWQPMDTGIIPSISAGYGFTDISGTGSADNSNPWTVGLQWDDAFTKSNAAGIAIGQNPSNGPINGNAVSDPLSLELFYKFQVSDNISITPGLFYITNSANQVSNQDLLGQPDPDPVSLLSVA